MSWQSSALDRWLRQPAGGGVKGAQCRVCAGAGVCRLEWQDEIGILTNHADYSEGQEGLQAHFGT